MMSSTYESTQQIPSPTTSVEVDAAIHRKVPYTTIFTRIPPYPGRVDDQHKRLRRPAIRRLNSDSVEEECRLELVELLLLGDDWDDDGALAIEAKCIEVAGKLIHSFGDDLQGNKPMIVPMTNGAVQLEWHNERRVLELEVDPSESVYYLKWDPDKCIEDEGVISASDTERARELLNWIRR